MKPVVVTRIERLPRATIDCFLPLGVSTTHEASGRAPNWPGPARRRWAVR